MVAFDKGSDSNYWLAVFGVLSLFSAALYPGVAEAEEGWEADWEIADGFRIDIDTDGFELPTAIAFVPNPGPDPKDPLYFVTELKGRVRVVTNDRTVLTFADGLFKSEFPPESGMAGLCLDPAHGFVFVTFAYQDETGVLRNNVIRLETKPRVFATTPSAQVAFTNLFLPFKSGESHQIGACQVRNDELFVSVGDGYTEPNESQDLDSLMGKILRMNLDGEPLEDNPLYESAEPGARNYVWAIGLRNPFGMEATEDRLFVADNGLAVDRFLEVRAGENYLWNGGDDWSIGVKASFVLSPSHGVVHLALYPKGSSLFPAAFRDRFYLALSGAVGQGKPSGILAIPYDLQRRVMAEVPHLLLRYRGNRDNRALTGVDFGPDGLYFVVIEPDAKGRTAVFKISYAPDKAHPYSLARTSDAKAVMRSKGCLGCHVVDGVEFGGTIGPSLQRDSLIPRLQDLLFSADYRKNVEQIDALDTDPWASYREARLDVLNADGDERIRRWVTYRILEPRFDRETSLMPRLNVTRSEAQLIARHLIRDTRNQSVERILGKIFPARSALRRRHLAIYLAAGILFGAIGAISFAWFLTHMRGRNRIA